MKEIRIKQIILPGKTCLEIITGRWVMSRDFPGGRKASIGEG
jgi:hypothetical protein